MVGNGESLLIVSMWTSMASWFTPSVLFCVANLIIGTLLIASNNKNHDDQLQGDSSTRITRVSSFLQRARSINLSSYTTTSAPHNLSSCTVTSAPHHEYVSHPSPSNTPNYSSSSRLAQSIYVGQTQPSQLTRAPSLLERVKSIKFSSIYNDDTFHTESEQISNSPRQLTRAPSFLDRVKSFKISSPFKQVPPSTQPENVDTYPSDHIPGDHPPVIRSKSEKPSKKKLLVEIKKSRSEMNMADDDDEDVDLRRPATTRERQNVVDEEVDAKADDFISKFKQQLKLQRLESLVRYNQMLKRQC